MTVLTRRETVMTLIPMISTVVRSMVARVLLTIRFTLVTPTRGIRTRRSAQHRPIRASLSAHRIIGAYKAFRRRRPACRKVADRMEDVGATRCCK